MLCLHCGTCQRGLEPIHGQLLGRVFTPIYGQSPGPPCALGLCGGSSGCPHWFLFHINCNVLSATHVPHFKILLQQQQQLILMTLHLSQHNPAIFRLLGSCSPGYINIPFNTIDTPSIGLVGLDCCVKFSYNNNPIHSTLSHNTYWLFMPSMCAPYILQD